MQARSAALANLVEYHDNVGSTTYRAGTLVYTRPQLTSLFLWLLGGDFAFAFFEQIFGRFIPLFAKELHASDTLIGVMTGSIAGLVNLFFLPAISVRSDRHCGPRGRRIPFLMLATPCTVASLLLVGFAPEVGRWTHGWLGTVVPVGEGDSSSGCCACSWCPTISGTWCSMGPTVG